MELGRWRVELREERREVSLARDGEAIVKSDSERYDSTTIDKQWGLAICRSKPRRRVRSLLDA